MSHDNLKKVINNLTSDKIKQMFPLPLKTGKQPISTAPPPGEEVGMRLSYAAFK